MTQKEEILIQKIKIGDERAAAELVSLYQRPIFNQVLRMLKNYDDAEDVTQEVFVKAYRSIESFQGTSSLHTWLYSIAKNAALDFLRKNRISGKTVSMETGGEENLPLEIPDESFSPEKLLERKDRRDLLLTMIDSLSPKLREIIILKDIEGYSYAEIGDILSLDRGTVCSRLARARQELREKMCEELR